MRRTAAAGIAIGWALLVVGGVRGVEALLDLQRGQEQELQRQRERLMRLRGWLEVEERLLARRREVRGRFAAVDGKEMSWVAVQGLQEIAAQQGLAITDLRPSQVRGRGKKGEPVFRLDAKLEGQLQGFDQLLQQLPQLLPGVRLEGLQLSPMDNGQVQSILRMEWTA